MSRSIDWTGRCRPSRSAAPMCSSTPIPIPRRPGRETRRAGGTSPALQQAGGGGARRAARPCTASRRGEPGCRTPRSSPCFRRRPSSSPVAPPAPGEASNVVAELADVTAQSGVEDNRDHRVETSQRNENSISTIRISLPGNRRSRSRGPPTGAAGACGHVRKRQPWAGAHRRLAPRPLKPSSICSDTVGVAARGRGRAVRLHRRTVQEAASCGRGRTTARRSSAPPSGPAGAFSVCGASGAAVARTSQWSGSAGSGSRRAAA